MSLAVHIHIQAKAQQRSQQTVFREYVTNRSADFGSLVLIGTLPGERKRKAYKLSKIVLRRSLCDMMRLYTFGIAAHS